MGVPVREAFEHWIISKWRPDDGAELLGGEWPSFAFAAWQAAKHRYAPKLTAEEAMRALFNANREVAAIDMGVEVDELLTFEQSRDSADEDERTPYFNAVENVNALRAAVVQFRDEPNPEPGACQ